MTSLRDGKVPILPQQVNLRVLIDLSARVRASLVEKTDLMKEVTIACVFVFAAFAIEVPRTFGAAFGLFPGRFRGSASLLSESLIKSMVVLVVLEPRSSATQFPMGKRSRSLNSEPYEDRSGSISSLTDT